MAARMESGGARSPTLTSTWSPKSARALSSLALARADEYRAPTTAVPLVNLLLLLHLQSSTSLPPLLGKRAEHARPTGLVKTVTSQVRTGTPLSDLQCRLRWSTQHLLGVYSQEFESLRFFSGVDSSAARPCRAALESRTHLINASVESETRQAGASRESSRHDVHI